MWNLTARSVKWPNACHATALLSVWLKSLTQKEHMLPQTCLHLKECLQTAAPLVVESNSARARSQPPSRWRKQSQGLGVLGQFLCLVFQTSRKLASPKTIINWLKTLLSMWFWLWGWSEDPSHKFISSQPPRFILVLIYYISINFYRTSPSCEADNLSSF